MDTFFSLLAEDPIAVIILLGWGAFLLFVAWFVMVKWLGGVDNDGGGK